MQFRISMFAWSVAAVAFTLYTVWQTRENNRIARYARLRPFKRAFRDQYLASEMNVPNGD
jgi:hypothetical protein